MSNDLKPLVILGARSYAREVADLVSEIPGYELTGFVENLDRDRCDVDLEGLPVHWVDDLAALASTHWGICGLGSTKRAALIAQAVGHGMRFATLIHPAARVSSRSVVGEGSLVCPGAQVASHTRIGAHVLVNRGATIGHDAEIGEFATIGPGVNIAGFCRIGVASFVGIGSIIVDRVSIGCGATIAAGSVVVRDVPERAMAAGMPAQIIKRDVEAP